MNGLSNYYYNYIDSLNKAATGAGYLDKVDNEFSVLTHKDCKHLATADIVNIAKGCKKFLEAAFNQATNTRDKKFYSDKLNLLFQGLIHYENRLSKNNYKIALAIFFRFSEVSRLIDEVQHAGKGALKHLDKQNKKRLEMIKISNDAISSLFKHWHPEGELSTKLKRLDKGLEVLKKASASTSFGKVPNPKNSRMLAKLVKGSRDLNFSMLKYSTDREKRTTLLKCRLVLKMIYAAILDKNPDIDLPTLNGGLPEDSISQIVHSLKDYQEKILKDSPSYSRVEAVKNALLFAIEVAKKLNKSAKEPAIEISQKVQELPPYSTDGNNPYVLISGGFSKGCGGHMVLWKVERDSEKTFSFTEWNTGNGASFLEVNGIKMTQPVTYTLLSADQLSPENLERLLNFQIPSDSHSMNLVHKLMEQLFFNPTMSNKKQGNPFPKQEKGSCYVQCLLNCLVDELGEREFHQFQSFYTHYSIKRARAIFELLDREKIPLTSELIFGIKDPVKAKHLRLQFLAEIAQAAFKLPVQFIPSQVCAP